MEIVRATTITLPIYAKKNSKGVIHCGLSKCRYFVISIDSERNDELKSAICDLFPHPHSVLSEEGVEYDEDSKVPLLALCCK